MEQGGAGGVQALCKVEHRLLHFNQVTENISVQSKCFCIGKEMAMSGIIIAKISRKFLQMLTLLVIIMWLLEFKYLKERILQLY